MISEEKNLLKLKQFAETITKEDFLDRMGTGYWGVMCPTQAGMEEFNDFNCSLKTCKECWEKAIEGQDFVFLDDRPIAYPNYSQYDTEEKDIEKTIKFMKENMIFETGVPSDYIYSYDKTQELLQDQQEPLKQLVTDYKERLADVELESGEYDFDYYGGVVDGKIEILKDVIEDLEKILGDEINENN